MQKAVIFLLIVGILIAIGIALSFYGSQIITEDLVSNETDLEPNKNFELVSNLDPSISEKGVYVVQIFNFKPDSIIVRLYDSHNTQLTSKSVQKESYEEQFEIFAAGQYKLIIENRGSEKFHVVAVLGHLPDKSKYVVGLTGFYILIVGLVGIAGVGIFAIKNRKKN